MPELDIDRLERLALAQMRGPLSTGVVVTPGELLALIQRARSAPEPPDAEPHQAS